MKLRSSIVVLIGLAMVALGWFAFQTRDDSLPPPDGRVAAYMEVQLEGADRTVALVQTPDGEYRYHIPGVEGAELLTPDQFARRVHVQQQKRSWWHALLNISTPLGVMWVALGLIGQLLFTGRMVVQWLASEKKHKSVVPVSFWWMSLVGASMLLTYFIWRKDIVGVIGQATGWLIYVRNLYLIYFARLAKAEQI